MSGMKKSVLAMVLAGGRGQRLYPLTKDRAKPAVPFGGKFRIIDFVLSNLVNSGIYSIYVLTQFKSQSLTEHILSGWSTSTMLTDNFVVPVPAQMRMGEVWYQGTADAIYQNLNLVHEAQPHLVCIFGGDHIYRMDVSHMISYHEQKMADCTVAAITVPRAEASSFGVIEIDADWRIVGFEEKPAEPKTLPNDSSRSLVSMGNYVFSGRALVDFLEDDAQDSSSSHDFGKDVIPSRIRDHRIVCYDFTRNLIPGHDGENTYWRDVGTIDSYFDSNMDLRQVVPQFNVYNRHWPIRTVRHHAPPVKFVHEEDNRTGMAVNSLVCEGTILSGCSVRNCIIGRNVKINSYAEISDTIIFDNVEIGRRARIHRAILDKNVHVPEDAVMGMDPEQDARDHFVSETGLVVVPKQPRYESHIGFIHI
jgi:glucose-1-phosphate adenylyltransferase